MLYDTQVINYNVLFLEVQGFAGIIQNENLMHACKLSLNLNQKFDAAMPTDHIHLKFLLTKEMKLP